MNEYLDWEIEQGRVGAFYLGMTKEELVKKLEDMGVEYRYTCNGDRVEIHGLVFVFEPRENKAEEMVLQIIFVGEGFRGKFKGRMGIGTIPCEMKGIEYYGEIIPYTMDNEFILPGYPGLTFSVDYKYFVDDGMPIQYISVTNDLNVINTAFEYKENEWMREDSIKLMAEYRKLGEEYRRGRNE